MKYSALLSLMVFALFCISCDSDEIANDYRDSFVAEYECSYALKTLTVFQAKETFVDTIFFSIDTVINISKSELDNEISFLDWNIIVNISGEIDSIYCNSGDCMECNYLPIQLGSTNLNFETDCGNLKTTWYTYKIVGVKQY